MKRIGIVLMVLVFLVMSVASCGGGPPTKMTGYEASAFTLEYPEDWEDSGMDIGGMTMAILSEGAFDLEDFGGLDEPPESAFVLVMYTPSEDSEFTLEDFDDEITEDEDVKIISRGDITVGGQKGKFAKAQGQIEEGADETAIMIVVVEDGDNTFAFVGMCPESVWGKNEKIFDYMVKTVKFQ
jgi:hypothetical protein